MMNSEDYKRVTSLKDVFDYSTINATLKEVISLNDEKLKHEIERILSKNKLDKPKLHSGPNDLTTNYYKVDLKSEDIEKIIDMFLELEVKNIGQNGETTATCSFYASLADKWSDLDS